MIKTYHDRAAGNHALIETVKMHAYKGARLTTAYRLTMLDSYDFLYYVSCYETLKDAETALYNRGPDWYTND